MVRVPIRPALWLGRVGWLRTWPVRFVRHDRRAQIRCACRWWMSSLSVMFGGDGAATERLGQRMSRGPGKLQRRLLAILEEDEGLIDTYELTARAFDYEPDETGQIMLSDARLVSVRRALSGLVRTGKLHDLGRHWRRGRKHWGNERTALRYLIRTMQIQNVTSTSAEVGERAKTMLPLIERAHELGVDLT